MKKILQDIAMLTFSALLTALAVQLFFSEHALTPGGITGMSITLSALSNISVDIISLSISIPLLIISTLLLGSKFGIKTLFITLMVPLFLRIIPSIHITNSVIIAGIIGGLLVGSSIVLAIRCQCATGGTDVIAMMLNKIIKKVDLSTILFVLDMIIVLSSWLLTNDIMSAIYSALTLFVIMQTIKFGTKDLQICEQESLSI